MQNSEHIKKIRNFSIIAHIDHGKSTLADRILEITGAVEKRNIKDRVLDTLDLEQERGITIKLQTAKMSFNYSGDHEEYKSGEAYILNLIDTPGHVDFSYEVSRSLAACEGALLLVDATQGIQAQTLSTFFQALDLDLKLIPVINKIDLPNAEVEQTKSALKDVFGFTDDEIILTSGKTGEGVVKLLNRIIEQVPYPKSEENQVTRALIFDSFYHEHKGVVAMIKLKDGKITNKDKLFMFGSKTENMPIEIGYLQPNMHTAEIINTGEVGYIATGLKDIRKVHVGDTVVKYQDYENNHDLQPIPGYKAPKPMVYASLYPVDAKDFGDFSVSLEKLALNDAALDYKKESSPALGTGYCCGFLGLLHLEITQERLEREFNINLMTTVPSVEYKVKLRTTDYSKIEGINTANVTEDNFLLVRTAAEFPDPTLVEYIMEPYAKLDLITPDTYIGPLMELSQKRRGKYLSMEYLIGDVQIKGQKPVMLHYEIPTAEIITDFFDQVKSITQGYASMDYAFMEYRKSEVVKISILVNEEPIEALSFLSHVQSATERGKMVVKKLKELIPKQQFKIPLQAAIGGKVIAREDISAMRKDVTAKLYGGDITRKMKVLERQKKGKAKLKKFGKVEVPKEAFLAVLKMD